MPSKKKPSKKKASKKKKVAAGKQSTAKPAKRAAKTKSVAATGKHAADTERGTLPEGVGFPVVGIGASAGGLEAITAFLKHLPADTGMAFVLVQHLAPDHPSMMTELLKRETPLQVSEVEDNTRVQPNHLYVIPPNTDLGLLNGNLQLISRRAKQHLPIDFFLQTLAEDQGSNAIGIILSGSASDGTLGLKAIKSHNGITFAQSKESSRYDSMPASAIAARCVDFVLDPEDIARELVHLSRHPHILRAELAAGKEPHEQVSSDLEKIFMLLRNRTGNDFTYYKHTTIRRRISRRMLVHKIDRLQDYVRFLSNHPLEVDALFQDILINVTSFFRDPETYKALQQEIFPALLKERNNKHPLRIWVPGCSTGEEVYSIIITLLETLGENIAGTTVQVFASDIDAQAIDKARAGVYPEGISADVNSGRLRRFFTKVPQGYRINKRLRDLCIFVPQNIIKDPPFSHLDLVVCRNMLIYMDNMLQRKILQTLHYALNPGGYLLLGSSESIGSASDLFAIADKKHRIYKSKNTGKNFHHHDTAPALNVPPLPTETTMAMEQRPMDLQRLAESLILNQYGPPGVVINEQLDIMQFIGHTGDYLDPAPGAASLNLMKLARPELTVELRVAVHEAMQSKQHARKDGARLHHDDITENVTIEVVPLLQHSDTDHHYLVLFRSMGECEPAQAAGKDADGKQDSRMRELEQELETTKTYMQTIIEDQEAANEELQSANEEIQSTNEELQSTNEELETAKEELQSTNEELITVNEELEIRNAELTTSNDDLKNIIASMELPLILLNDALQIRYFSPRAHDLLNLIDGDIGRSISDIRPNVNTGDIAGYVHKVVEHLQPMTREVRSESDRWYNMTIRPYRTEDNRISGAVIVFIDITDSKTLQRAMRLATVVVDSNDAVTVQDFSGRILAWNPRAAAIYGYTEDEALDANIEIIIPPEKRSEFEGMMKILRQGKNVLPFKTERLDKQGNRLHMLVTLSVLHDANGQPTAIATTERQFED